MDSSEFREFGKAMIDYIADYLDNIRDRQVLPSVNPGYLQPKIPNEAPQSGEHWKKIMDDIEQIIMPGITHWHSPNFHAYCPTANSYPGIVGEMLSAGIGCVGFSWMSSPACTELEVAMMNWLGKLIGLPEQFLNCSNGPGGGIIQGSASEATFIALLTAKEKTVRYFKEKHPQLSDEYIKGKLVAYTSNQANSSVEKAGLLGSIPMRLLPTDKDGSLPKKTLEEAINEDKKAGLIPCYVVATLGTTGTCAFDNLEEIGAVCKEENVWLHIDAAYAGSAFACPEYRYLMKGVEYADSFDFNPHKWMMVNSDCSAMWVRNSKHLVEAFNVNRIYLQHEYEGVAPDYRHWQISLGRRFRALKLWFVLRSYGVDGIQKHIRTQIGLANYFESLVKGDSRFEIATKSMGLVCFKLQAGDRPTQLLLEKLTDRKNIYVIPCHFRGSFVIRFVVCSRLTEMKDIDYGWKEISEVATEILNTYKCKANGDFVSLVTVSSNRTKRKEGDILIEH